MQMAVESGEEAALVRAIGLPGLTVNIVNTTIGASIFVMPALVAAILGSASPLAFLACALAMALFVTSFAIAGSMPLFRWRLALSLGFSPESSFF